MPPPVLPPVQTADIDGDNTVSAGEQVLSAYAPTVATVGGPSVTTLQQAGLQGFAASTTQNIAAITNTTGTFKVATITMAAGGASLTIQVDGQTFVLPSSGPSQTGKMFAGGPDATFYAFGAAPGTNGSQASVINGAYSSLAVFGKDVTLATPGTPSSNAGYVLVATGAETPVSGLPAQIATYKGSWGIALANGVAGSSGQFDATANFANKTLSWDVIANGSPAGSGTATISGNKFAGNFTNSLAQQGGLVNPEACVADCTWNGTGQVIGAFYGPNAEEVAGVLSGSSTSTEGKSSAMSGFFLGAQP